MVGVIVLGVVVGVLVVTVILVCIYIYVYVGGVVSSCWCVVGYAYIYT